MRHSQSASEVIREVSSISANGIGGSLETRFDSPPSRVGVSPPRHRGISEGTTAGRSTSPVLVAALSGRGVDAAYQFEARARELEAEGAALRAEAEAEVAAAWARSVLPAHAIHHHTARCARWYPLGQLPNISL